MKNLILLLVGFTFLISCKKEKVTPIDTNSETPYALTTSHSLTDIAYGENAAQKMDVYLPANRTTSTKVFVLIHGGGWNAGDKADFNYVFNWLKIAYPSYAIINLNYRLATLTQPGYDMQIADVTAAISEIKKAKYGVGTELMLIGGSAGAHLAMMYGYRHDTSNQVKGICNIVGPVDFTDTSYTNDPNYEYALIYVVGPYTYAARPELWRNVSPVSHIKSTSPPTISFYGDQDHLIPTTQMGLLDAKLTEKGVDHSSTMYPGEGHIGWSQATNTDFTAKVMQFIQEKFN